MESEQPIILRVPLTVLFLSSSDPKITRLVPPIIQNYSKIRIYRSRANSAAREIAVCFDLYILVAGKGYAKELWNSKEVTQRSIVSFTGLSTSIWTHWLIPTSQQRYRNNRHVSMGAEKWLDIELWETPKECFKVLKTRVYMIATTHLGMDTISIYDMDWSQPTAIVVGNEGSGIRTSRSSTISLLYFW